MIVSPSFAGFYPTYGARENAIVCGNLALQSLVGSNGSNLFQRQFRRPATFASVRCAVAYFVGVVVLRCVPSKVAQGVIGWVAVVMASLSSVWAWAYKCLQNYLMRPLCFGFVISPEQNKRPSVTFYDGEFLSFAGNCIAKVPKVGNLVNAFITNNGEPSFHAGNHTRLGGI
tara:strand:+ start:4692 stop:5207 length:516 start_codon:yes stop_codon:yes gene_type:complete